MIFPTHIKMIYQLSILRDTINSTLNKAAMMAAAQQAYNLTQNIHTVKEGKEKILLMLQNEMRNYANSSTEIEVVQFQLASSLLMLMLQFVEGSLADIQMMITEYKKIAA